MQQQIQLIIAENNDFRRRSLLSLLGQFSVLNVAGEARTGRELLEIMSLIKTDILLLDLEMPEMNGFEALEHITKEFPGAKVIVLSMHFDMLLAYELMMKGARACLPKNIGVETLVKTIRGVFENGYHFSEEVSQSLLQTSLNLMAKDPGYLKARNTA